MKASLAARAVPALLLAGMLTAGLAAPALAQSGGMDHHDQNAGMDHHEMHDGARADRGMTDQRLVERRIADLHERLHITPAQGPQWRAFAHVMRENARNMDHLYRHRAEELASMNAQQDLDSYARLERIRARDVQRLVQPFNQLYASLSPQQKQDADNLFRSIARHHEHRADAAHH